MGAEFANHAIAGWATLVDAPERATDDVERVTGRPARTFAQWARDHADDFARRSTAEVANGCPKQTARHRPSGLPSGMSIKLY